MDAASQRYRPVKCPPFPPILDALTRALDDATGDDRPLLRALRADKALSLNLLRYANSAWVARNRPAESVAQAVMVVGLAGLRSLVLTDFARSCFTTWGPVEEFLWEHALGSAIAAALERPGGGRATEDLYLCGLLHNVGKTVLYTEKPEAYRDVLHRVLHEQEDFSQAEQHVFGATHTTASGAFLSERSVPALVKQAALHHHRPEKAATAEAAAICKILPVADALAYRASPAWAALQGDREEPRWIGARLEAAFRGAALGALAARLELLRVELMRMRSYFVRT